VSVLHLVGQPTAAASTQLQAGAYVTDGYNLFAILSVASCHSEQQVTYEDCRTLDLLACPLAELRKRRLELVRPADS
jgi:hypothetical protein